MPSRRNRIQLVLFVFMALFAAAPGADAGSGPLPDSTPHGILVDRTLPMAHVEDLDGADSSAVADLARWRQVVHELRKSAEQPLAWSPARDLALAARDRHPQETIPLALVSAVVDRMDASGAVVPARVFTFAPLRERTYDGAATAFVLDPADILRHETPAATHLEFDADDGLGWRALVPGRRLEVQYTETGRRTLRLRAALPDGTVLEAAARLDVQRLVTPAPTATWPITATEPWGGVAGSGQAYLYLAAGRTVPENPVVVVEGFDLDDTMDWPVLYDVLNTENMLEELRAAGYDAVVLDFTEATAPIQRNAFVLTELLAQVKAAAGPDQSLVVIGASMGGLVSRYALSWLENQGVAHDVRTFISFDSPQLGANIPLGLQEWLDFFRSEAEAASYLLSRLDSPAARQMLLYHHGSSGGATPAADPQYAALRDDLAAVGDWPAQCRMVAVANGSGNGQNQGFLPGAQIIRYEYRSFLVDIDGNVWAVRDGPTGTIFDGMINQIWPLPDTYRTVTATGTLPWDSAPGGNRASMAQMDTTAVPYGDIQALHQAHCFIPTVSALALVGADPFFVPATAGDVAALSPFDAVYWPEVNQEHIAITPQNKGWFLAEIQSGVSAVPDALPMGIAAARLLPAAPNPFNPRTAVRFELAVPGPVRLAVYDVAGRLVRTLVAGEDWPAGHHAVTWQGRTEDGATAAAGRYIARLEAGGTVAATGLTLVK